MQKLRFSTNRQSVESFVMSLKKPLRFTVIRTFVPITEVPDMQKKTPLSKQSGLKLAMTDIVARDAANCNPVWYMEHDYCEDNLQRLSKYPSVFVECETFTLFSSDDRSGAVSADDKQIDFLHDHENDVEIRQWMRPANMNTFEVVNPEYTTKESHYAS